MHDGAEVTRTEADARGQINGPGGRKMRVTERDELRKVP